MSGATSVDCFFPDRINPGLVAVVGWARSTRETVCCSSSRHPMLLSASRTVRVNRLVSLLVRRSLAGAGGEQKRPPVFRLMAAINKHWQ